METKEMLTKYNRIMRELESKFRHQDVHPSAREALYAALDSLNLLISAVVEDEKEGLK
mgnify:CR=1 FL=1